MRSPLISGTVESNVAATNNVLCAIAASGLDIHVVHLGTMGVYGYSGNAPIPEVTCGRDSRGLMATDRARDPVCGESWQHLPHDRNTFFRSSDLSFYNKNDKVRITDLSRRGLGHQYGRDGSSTTGSSIGLTMMVNMERCLIASSFRPRWTSPNGLWHTGSQTRAFIEIRDSVELRACLTVEIHQKRVIAFESSINKGHRVADLATLIAGLSGAKINCHESHREATQRSGRKREGLRALGLIPRLSRKGSSTKSWKSRRCSSRVDPRRMLSTSYWNSDREAAINRPQLVPEIRA